jgi:DNA polymerase-3 subunit gamma/tau
MVGQEPVVRTLTGAVERGKVHHAYLFVGARGTGKTSMAKILAASLNCDRGPTTEPCGECESCRAIARASSLDVIEMDAASNNSVDDIRELREGVAYAPVSGRTKVYILDEAHMLSTAAWNAFLKTLEEPPPNTVFVLATTEAQKVPATVVDRCHRFDFHRPTVEQIASVLERVAAAESIDIPPPAVAAVARSATGSFRDALGTLEQLLAYSGREIALEDALVVLGRADARLLEEAVDAVAEGDAGRALKTLAACVEQGRDAGAFASDLEVRLREVLVVQTLDEVPAELSLTPEADAALHAQAQRVGHATVVRLLELLGAAMEGVRAGADPRTRLELALVKAAKPELDGSIRALLARIEQLEGAPGSRRERRGSDDEGPPRAAPAASPVAAEGLADPAEGLADPAQGLADPAQGLADPAEGLADPAEGRADPAEGLADPSEGLADPSEGLAERAPGDLDSMRALWPAVVELVRAENALLGALIAEAQPVAAVDDQLIVAFVPTAQFLKKKAEDPANLVRVSEALREISGRRWRLSYELREELEAHARTGPPPSSEEEWVRRFMEEFDAEEIPGDGTAEVSEQLVSEERGA